MKVGNMEIRTARVENIPELMILVHSAYRDEGAKRGWTTDAHLVEGSRTTPERLQCEIETEGSAILICVNQVDFPDGRILGCVQVEKVMKNEELKCCVGLLTVSPELQANGIGKILMNAAHDWAKELKCVALTITVVSVREELIAWYKRHGFEATGEREPFFADPIYGTPKKQLELNVYEKRL